MAVDLPDPTPAEARALVVGLGTSWVGWGLAAATLFANGWAIGLVPFFVGFGAGVWTYLAVFHVAARHEGTTVGRLFLRSMCRPPWTAFRGGSGWTWLSVLRPRYFRRAAEVLGWPPGVVLSVLGALLASDLAIFVWMMLTLPTHAGSS